MKTENFVKDLKKQYIDLSLSCGLLKKGESKKAKTALDKISFFEIVDIWSKVGGRPNEYYGITEEE